MNYSGVNMTIAEWEDRYRALKTECEQAKQNEAMNCGHALKFLLVIGHYESQEIGGCSECERIRAMETEIGGQKLYIKSLQTGIEQMEEQLRAADDLQLIGAMMSNICFNLAQPNTECDERARKSMNTCRIKWDKLQSAYIALRGR